MLPLNGRDYVEVSHYGDAMDSRFEPVWHAYRLTDVREELQALGLANVKGH